jgi:rod shape-determining protein MreB and related proteins
MTTSGTLARSGRVVAPPAPTGLHERGGTFREGAANLRMSFFSKYADRIGVEFASRRIGIDLGTANILIYERGRGIVVDEPAVVALSNRDNTVVAVGTNARDMLGRTPQSISVIRPMRDGVIADYIITEAMLQHFIQRVIGRINVVRPEVIVCVPAGVTSVERRAVREAAEQAGARRPAHLLPEPIAAAIGARIPIDNARGNMIVDIGGGRCEAAVISMYGIVASESVRMAGDKFDEAIVSYLKRRHNLVIGERTAEELKIKIGAALPVERELSVEIKGRDQVTGLPKSLIVTSTDIAKALHDPLLTIIQTVRGVLEQTPPELASDVIDQGIVLTGGGALLRSVDRLLADETGLPVHVADNPLQTVAIGAGIAADHWDQLRRQVSIDEEAIDAV